MSSKQRGQKKKLTTFSFSDKINNIKSDWIKPMPNSSILINFFQDFTTNVIYIKSQNIPKDVLKLISNKDVLVIGFIPTDFDNPALDYLVLASYMHTILVRIGGHKINEDVGRILSKLTNPMIFGINLNDFREQLKNDSRIELLNIPDFHDDPNRSHAYSNFLAEHFSFEILEFLATKPEEVFSLTVKQCIYLIFSSVTSHFFLSFDWAQNLKYEPPSNIFIPDQQYQHGQFNISPDMIQTIPIDPIQQYQIDSPPQTYNDHIDNNYLSIPQTNETFLTPIVALSQLNPIQYQTQSTNKMNDNALIASYSPVQNNIQPMYQAQVQYDNSNQVSFISSQQAANTVSPQIIDQGPPVQNNQANKLDNQQNDKTNKKQEKPKQSNKNNRTNSKFTYVPEKTNSQFVYIPENSDKSPINSTNNQNTEITNSPYVYKPEESHQKEKNEEIIPVKLVDPIQPQLVSPPRKSVNLELIQNKQDDVSTKKIPGATPSIKTGTKVQPSIKIQPKIRPNLRKNEIDSPKISVQKPIRVKPQTREDLDFDDAYCNFIASTIDLSGLSSSKAKKSPKVSKESEFIKSGAFWDQIDDTIIQMKESYQVIGKIVKCTICSKQFSSMLDFFYHSMKEHSDITT